MSKRFNSIESVVADLQKGKMVIVVDDADRENEGDLIMAAQFGSPAAVNFMAKYGRGLICVPTTSERLQQLGIERMVRQNRETFKTDFQVSVDAARRITTGISAADRAETIRIMAEPTAVPEDLVQPGHVFPLRARPGGVLQRAGHTEAAVDLAVLAGCRPIGVICEIMNDDGSMARLPELLKFSKRHRVNLCTMADLIKYRRTRELRHRRGEQKTRLRHGPARIRPRRANPRGPRAENDPVADEQSEKSRRPRRLRFENRRASADQGEAESAQRAVFENEAGEVGTSA